jgi:hypothetical protein
VTATPEGGLVPAGLPAPLPVPSHPPLAAASVASRLRVVVMDGTNRHALHLSASLDGRWATEVAPLGFQVVGACAGAGSGSGGLVVTGIEPGPPPSACAYALDEEGAVVGRSPLAVSKSEGQAVSYWPRPVGDDGQVWVWWEERTGVAGGARLCWSRMAVGGLAPAASSPTEQLDLDAPSDELDVAPGPAGLVVARTSGSRRRLQVVDLSGPAHWAPEPAGEDDPGAASPSLAPASAGLAVAWVRRAGAGRAATVAVQHLDGDLAPRGRERVVAAAAPRGQWERARLVLPPPGVAEAPLATGSPLAVVVHAREPGDSDQRWWSAVVLSPPDGAPPGQVHWLEPAGPQYSAAAWVGAHVVVVHGSTPHLSTFALASATG